VLVAIWGHETSYGIVTGDFDLLNSLATLAYEGRRRDLFADEFVATLKLYDRGIPRSQLKGSWAGATGYPQFLPSVYLRLAVDADGDGRPNIWSSQLDALPRSPTICAMQDGSQRALGSQGERSGQPQSQCPYHAAARSSLPQGL
jgi:membrane-bound lytic murein transglycosylase B